LWDKPLPYISFPRTKCYVHKICQIKKLITIRRTMKKVSFVSRTRAKPFPLA
jgi:hypothetical protein